MMRALVNGNPIELADATTVELLVERMTGSPEPRGVAVARNGAVLSRTAWSRPVEDGDRIEIVKAVQGG
jgi:sulfur carrier protein